MGTNPANISEKRPSYPQNWRAYNSAQTVEKDMFQELLADLVSGVPKVAPKNGRPPLPLADAIFAATFKVYTTFSTRRFKTDLKAAYERGLISRKPHHNTIINTLQNDDVTPILISLIERSAVPLRAVEVDFAADSSGFQSSRILKWNDKWAAEEKGIDRSQRDWVKCHIMCGVKTNIVTAIAIGSQNAYDGRFLPPLLATTHRNFNISEVSADKGYSSKKNFEVVAQIGAVPFIAFNENVTGKGGGMWTRMYHYFQYRRAEFQEHYHKRSNVEATFSMVKRKFGSRLRSRTDTAMKNEALCKFLCHNIVVLIHEIHELGITTEFWPANPSLPTTSSRIV